MFSKCPFLSLSLSLFLYFSFCRRKHTHNSFLGCDLQSFIHADPSRSVSHASGTMYGALLAWMYDFRYSANLPIGCIKKSHDDAIAHCRSSSVSGHSISGVCTMSSEPVSKAGGMGATGGTRAGTRIVNVVIATMMSHICHSSKQYLSSLAFDHAVDQPANSMRSIFAGLGPLELKWNGQC